MMMHKPQIKLELSCSLYWLSDSSVACTYLDSLQYHGECIDHRTGSPERTPGTDKHNKDQPNIIAYCIGVGGTINSTHLFIGQEVDDRIVNRAGLGKIHRHGGHQRWNVDFWIHNYNYRDGRVRQPADEEGSDHGQDHPKCMFVVLQAVFSTLKLNAFVDLKTGDKLCSNGRALHWQHKGNRFD